MRWGCYGIAVGLLWDCGGVTVGLTPACGVDCDAVAPPAARLVEVFAVCKRNDFDAMQVESVNRDYVNQA